MAKQAPKSAFGVMTTTEHHRDPSGNVTHTKIISSRVPAGQAPAKGAGSGKAARKPVAKQMP